MVHSALRLPACTAAFRSTWLFTWSSSSVAADDAQVQSRIASTQSRRSSSPFIKIDSWLAAFRRVRGLKEDCLDSMRAFTRKD